MGKKRRTLFAAMLIIVLCGLAWWLFRPKAPQLVCDGKSLDFWIDEWHSSAGPQPDLAKHERAEAAIRKIGTNALPALLQMAGAVDSPPLHSRTGLTPHWMSTIGFCALRSAAKPAVPDLIALLHHKNHEVRYTAVLDLEEIGPEAEICVPALLKCLDDPDWNVRRASTAALQEFESRTDIIIPALIKRLDESYRATNCYAESIDTLMHFAEYPEIMSAVPRLTPFLKDRDYKTRAAASNALEVIEGEADSRARHK